MTTHFLKFTMTLFAASTLLACQNNFEVSQNIQQAVTDNQTAANLVEWESSSAHPEILFEKWNEAVTSGSVRSEILSEQICTEFARVSELELSVFEQELAQPENRELLAPCIAELNSRLDHYYLSQRPRAESGAHPQEAGFKFPDNIQKRDTSSGYFAWSGDVARKEIVLTFDDGPSNQYTESILRSLKDVNARAVFFSQGKNAILNPEIVKKIAADGHSIGSHSMSHYCLAAKPICQGKNGYLLTFEEAVAEIRGAHQVLYDILGWVDPFFRFPYGEASSEQKEFLKRNQVGEFAWNMDSEDWRATSNEHLLAKALSEVDRAGRGIILFHDIQRRTAEILPRFLKEVYHRGFSVVLLQPADLQSRFNSKLVRKPNKP